MKSLIFIFSLTFTFSRISADFTPHFRKFLHDSYGIAITGQLERTDLGMDASFGGKENPTEVPQNPVIIVHGITNKASRFGVSFWKILLLKLISTGHRGLPEIQRL